MLRSQLNEGLVPGLMPGDADCENGEQQRNNRSPSKARSLSDGANPPALSPSPKFREPEKGKSKDDSMIDDSPTTARRLSFLHRGLSLQMPGRDLMSPSSSACFNRAPLSPKLDRSQTYGSPTSVLPRRSRGLDFSRAATNLHHSTLAEQSSPDSSPTISGRAMNIPIRKNGLQIGSSSEALNNSSPLWSSMANADRTNISSSYGSINMIGSDSSESGYEEDDLMDDIDDSILTTHQVKAGAFSSPNQENPIASWGFSPAVSSLMNFQRARLRHPKSRNNSSSAGSGTSMVSPSSKSPPIMRSYENANGYFTKDLPVDIKDSRRESISWAANQLHISGNDSDDGRLKSTLENVDGMPITPVREGQRGLTRRPVTRRGNMLPKTKGFARIRAALAEENTPVETEVRREAEVVRQTRESDMDLESRLALTSKTIPQASPRLGPSTQGSILEDEVMADISASISNSFKQQAIRNGQGKEYWKTSKEDTVNCSNSSHSIFLPRRSSIGLSEDISLDSPLLSTTPFFIGFSQPISDRRSSSPSRSATPQPTAAEIAQKFNKKRRRDDDFDIGSLKRRAVSPGMSVHNSPVMQSPMQRDHQWMGGSRPSSNASSHVDTGKTIGNGGMKRVGFQGMVDTNDGLMKMSIE